MHVPFQFELPRQCSNLSHKLKPMSEFAFVTTCKGRLHHIKETLPLMVMQKPDEIVVVDYGCPDRVGNWVEENFPSVKVVRVTDDPGFCVSRARNIGVSATHSSWLCLIDADVKTSPGWLDHMRQLIQTKHYYRAGIVGGGRDSETFGTLFCERSAFDATGGYDEVMRGWGAEDKDFYAQLARHGIVESEYPPLFVNPIRHGDQERIAFQEIRNKKLQDTINVCYGVAKSHLLDSLNISALPLHTRETLMHQVRDQFLGPCESGNNRNRTNSIHLTIDIDEFTSSTGPKKLVFNIVRHRRYMLFGPSGWRIKN